MANTYRQHLPPQDAYAPATMIDGKPVQQFLQDTYISAMMVIADAMKVSRYTKIQFDSILTSLLTSSSPPHLLASLPIHLLTYISGLPLAH